jgi:hypothetical protein
MNNNRKSLVDAMSTEHSNSMSTIATSNDSKGTKKVIFRVPPEAHYQLKKLAVEERSQIQTLAQEALNDLFIKYKLPPIS